MSKLVLKPCRTKVKKIMLLLKKTKALEESYEYLYEHNRPVFVKLKAEPDNPYDRNAIAVTGNLRGEGSLTNFFFRWSTKPN